MAVKAKSKTFYNGDPLIDTELRSAQDGITGTVDTMGPNEVIARGKTEAYGASLASAWQSLNDPRMLRAPLLSAMAGFYQGYLDGHKAKR